MYRTRQRGSTMLEFVFAGIPAIFMMISIAEVGRGMWEYHTLARAVDAGAHLAAIRGQGCTTGTNTCSISLGTLASAIQSEAVGLPANYLNVQFTTNSGAVTTCDPLSNCTSNATTWPPSSNSDNVAGNTVTVSAQFTFRSALAMVWPHAGTVNFGTYTFGASSTQLILF